MVKIRHSIFMILLVLFARIAAAQDSESACPSAELESVDGYFDRANDHLDQESYACAIADYTRVIELAPEHAVAYNNRGWAHYKMDNFEQAIDDYGQAIGLNPTALTYLNRGRAYSDQGNHEQAIADNTRAIELQPEYADAYNNRGWDYYKLGDFERAIDDYNRAISIDPDSAITFFNRGLAYYELNDLESAIASYDAAIEIQPDYPGAKDSRNRAFLVQILTALTFLAILLAGVVILFAVWRFSTRRRRV